jgi:hypothetical protein
MLSRLLPSDCLVLLTQECILVATETCYQLLSSNGQLFLLNYSGFQPSCQNIHPITAKFKPGQQHHSSRFKSPWYRLNLSDIRRIHKISSLCKYCRFNDAVTMVCMRAEFVGPFGRHGRNLQTTEPSLHIVLCVYNVLENQKAHRLWNALCNLYLECKKHETCWHSLWTLWGVWRTCHEWFSGMEMGENL